MHRKVEIARFIKTAVYHIKQIYANVMGRQRRVHTTNGRVKGLRNELPYGRIIEVMCAYSFVGKLFGKN